MIFRLYSICYLADQYSHTDCWEILCRGAMLMAYCMSRPGD